MNSENIFERDFWILGRLVKVTDYCTVTEDGAVYHLKGRCGQFLCKVVNSDRATAEKEFIKAVMQYLRGYK